MGEKFRRVCDWVSRKGDAIAIFLSGACVAAFLIIILAAALTLLGGCSTGEVTAGANISCLAFSIKPEVRFDGINFGLPIVTNVTCTCTNSNSTPQLDPP